MRILVVASELPPVRSGVARSVGRLVDGYRRAGHEVEELSTADERGWSFGEIRVSMLARRWARLAATLENVDVVELHGPLPFVSDLFLARWRLLRRRPKLIYVHHFTVEIERLRPLVPIYDRAHRWLARTADSVVTTSESYATMQRTRGGPDVVVIPWAVDAPPEHLEAPEPGSGDLRVLLIGQHRPYKGIDVAIDACAGVDGIELEIIGAGPLEDEHRRQIESSGATNITMRGGVPDRDLDRSLALADVIVLPSRNRSEAFGMVLLEGMAAGAYPVASDLPGVRDVAQLSGDVVPVDDAAALRSTLLALHLDRSRLVEGQRRSVEEARRFTWERCIADHLTLLEANHR